MSVKQKVEYYPIGEVEKYDFFNGYKTIFGGLGVPIKDAILRENEYFNVFVLNHKDKSYIVGHSSNLRSYAYIVGRSLNGQRAAANIPSLMKVIPKNENGNVSVEFVPAVAGNFEACMNVLKDWRCVGSRPTEISQDNFALVRALHLQTGWVRYFTVEDSKAHSITSQRWSQLRLACRDIGPRGSVDSIELHRSQEVQRGATNIRLTINEDINNCTGFSFDVLKVAKDVTESKKLRGDVRGINAEYYRNWFTKENITRIGKKLNSGERSLEKPVVLPNLTTYSAPVTVAPNQALVMPAEETIRKIEEQAVSLKEQIGLGPIPTETVETEIVEFELDGEVEQLYIEQRAQHAKNIAMRIILSGMGGNLSITSLTEVMAKVINGSPMFTNLIGEVTPLMIENAILHNVAPNPQQDFLFFEIINIVSKYVEKKVCHE